MKKLTSVFILFAIVAVILYGCTNEKTVDLAKAMDEINSKFSFDNLTAVKGTQKLKAYYQINEDDVKQFSAEFSSDTTNFVELIFVEAVDADSAKSIATRLNNHYETRVSQSKCYNPELADMLKNCSVKTNGRYVALIISDKAEKIEQKYNSYFE